jgi:hypothetical protein
VDAGPGTIARSIFGVISAFLLPVPADGFSALAPLDQPSRE